MTEDNDHTELRKRMEAWGLERAELTPDVMAELQGVREITEAMVRQQAKDRAELFNRPGLTEAEWDACYPPLDEDDSTPVSADEFDGSTPVEQVWSCIDDISEKDDRIYVSGIVPGADAFYLSSVPVPPGQAFIVRIPRED